MFGAHGCSGRGSGATLNQRKRRAVNKTATLLPNSVNVPGSGVAVKANASVAQMLKAIRRESIFGWFERLLRFLSLCLLVTVRVYMKLVIVQP
jgi:hypothetical protein